MLDDYLKFMKECEEFLSNDAVTIEDISMLAENKIEGRVELLTATFALEKFIDSLINFSSRIYASCIVEVPNYAGGLNEYI